MAIVAAQIELQTYSETAALRLSNVQKFDDNSGYSCNLSVRSGGFACDHLFGFDDESLADAIASLRRMTMAIPPKQPSSIGMRRTSFVSR